MDNGTLIFNTTGTYVNAGFTATISYPGDFSNLTTSGGNDVVLFNFISSVPEPGTVALRGLTGFFGLQWYLRRKPAKVEPKTESENNKENSEPVRLKPL